MEMLIFCVHMTQFQYQQNNAWFWDSAISGVVKYLYGICWGIGPFKLIIWLSALSYFDFPQEDINTLISLDIGFSKQSHISDVE